VTPGEPLDVTPGEPLDVTPGEPLDVTPGEPLDVTPGEPLEVPPAESSEVSPPPEPYPLAEDKSVEQEPVYSPGSFPFSVYFGSFQTKEKAEEAIAQYSGKGLSPFWVKVRLGDKGTWYRVYDGCFSDVEQARRYIHWNDLTEAAIKKTTYADLIGGYNNGDDLRHMRQKVEALGYSPYSLKDQDNRYFLFVGAFLTEEGAEEQLEELRSDGILSRIVKR
jgi:cell division protein FtsN